MKPVFSATPTPRSATSTTPNGANPVKVGTSCSMKVVRAGPVNWLAIRNGSSLRGSISANSTGERIAETIHVSTSNSRNRTAGSGRRFPIASIPFSARSTNPPPSAARVRGRLSLSAMSPPSRKSRRSRIPDSADAPIIARWSRGERIGRLPDILSLAVRPTSPPLARSLEGAPLRETSLYWAGMSPVSADSRPVAPGGGGRPSVSPTSTRRSAPPGVRSSPSSSSRRRPRRGTRACSTACCPAWPRRGPTSARSPTAPAAAGRGPGRSGSSTGCNASTA